ncbi:hypothetical protein SAMN04488063_3650 [Halopelagius inordinatus]|uniref:Halo transducer protein n=1 Tax=Halopelagius inordinatus TaxID=553467 RepID=A0A1I2WQG0_9EURY|nr:hypothetical protein [Halopelagius inordinatus]SFH03573.1 hypothetical protein SAMN04488063_3650 [Halopelagius inordinatus]
MSSEDGERTGENAVGASLSEAVDELVSGRPSRDPETVRTVLGHVADDDVVTEEAVDDALTDTSMALSTAETRTELASMALSDARETADPVSDLETVDARLDRFEARVTRLETRISDVGSDLQTAVERRGGPDDLYDFVTELRRITSDANAIQRAADSAQTDLDAFERWATNADVRAEELDADADALERSLDELAETAEELESADRNGEEAASFGTDDAVDIDAAWADAMLRHRVVGLLLADARAELSDLRRWANRDGLGELDVPDRTFGERADELEARLDELGGRREAVGDRLDGPARPARADRFERLLDFDAAFTEFEPPVPWDEVRTELERHRSEIDGLA